MVMWKLLLTVMIRLMVMLVLVRGCERLR